MALEDAAFSTDWTLRQDATFQPTMALRWRRQQAEDRPDILEQM